MKKFFLFIFLLISAVELQAQTTNGELYLKRLSRRIKGLDPSIDELKQLQTACNRTQFFHDKIKEYLGTPAHADNLSLYLDELFKFQVAPSPFHRLEKLGSYASRFKASFGYFNSLNDLFRRIGLENLSWDELLTAKRYNAYSARGGYRVYGDASGTYYMSDLGFLNAIASGLPATYHGAITSPSIVDEGTGEEVNRYPVAFEVNDSRIAGAITTSRFFQRYTNTALNKNRRRAAAIYRIFLGKNMIPAIEGGKDEIHALVNLAFTKNYNVKVEKTQDLFQKDIHGQRADCFACHRMLDPMGRTFQSSGLILSDEPSAGALVLPKRNYVNRAAGIGDLAKDITLQPEYEATQVKHFWRWYVGEDVPLSKSRLQEVIAAFNSLGRRTNDFIAYLVSQPEFVTPEKYLKPVYSEQAFAVRSLFETRCMNCHDNGIGPQFDPTSWDWPPERAQKILNDVYDQVIVEKAMPRGTKLSDGEFNLLKKWLESGAPNDAGELMIDPKQLPQNQENI